MRFSSCAHAPQQPRACPPPTKLQDKHGAGPLLSKLMADIMRTQPADPLQFMIDSLTLSAEDAMQVGVHCA